MSGWGGGEWTGKKATNVIDRCEVDESFVEGCLQTVQHTDKHLLGIFRSRLVFAADFSREPEMHKVAALCMNFEKRKFAVKPLYCFIQITQQLLLSLERHVQLLQVSKNVCQDAEPNLKLGVQLSDRTTGFLKKANNGRKQCKNSLQNCSTAQSANTVVNRTSPYSASNVAM